MKRFITLKAGQLLLHIFHFLFFFLYFESIHLSALLLIFNFLFPSSTFGKQNTFFFFHTHLLCTCCSKLLSLFIVFLLFLSYYIWSLSSVLSLFTFVFCAVFLPSNRLYTNYICKAQYSDN